MPSPSASYLAAKLSRVPALTVSVTVGAVTTRGHFRHETELVDDVGGTTVLRDQRSVLVRTGDLAGVGQETAITVDGIAYRVRQVLPEGDGTFTRYLIARA